MKHLLWLPFLSLGALLFTGCASNSHPGYGDNTGPFDEHGNYRDDWADDPTKWRRPGGGKPAPQLAKNDLPPANAVPLPTSAPNTYTAPKPRPTVAAKPKPKPKPKPKVTRYTVKKGDNLYNIARRNGSSVAAIQKANNISGSLIRPGQSLVIPKR